MVSLSCFKEPRPHVNCAARVVAGPSAWLVVDARKDMAVYCANPANLARGSSERFEWSAHVICQKLCV